MMQAWKRVLKHRVIHSQKNKLDLSGLLDSLVVNNQSFYFLEESGFVWGLYDKTTILL